MHDKRMVAVLAGLIFIGMGVRGIVTGKTPVRGGTCRRIKEPRMFWFLVTFSLCSGAFMVITALLWL
jgi:hypothetical protein